MKKIFSAWFATGFLFLAMSGNANALPIVNSTTVGEEDTLIKAAVLPNSGKGTEVKWVNTTLSLSGVDAFTVGDLTKTNKKDTDWVKWYSVDNADSGLYAFEFLTDDPAYFYIKVGAGNSFYTHLLFENNDTLAWGVVNLSQVFGDVEFEIKNFGKFSHIGELGTTPIPEPTTTMLFALGVIGFAGVARRRVSKK